MRLKYALFACVVFAVAACSAGGVTPNHNVSPDRHANVNVCPVDTGCGGGGGGTGTAVITSSQFMPSNCPMTSAGCGSVPTPSASPGPVSWFGGPVAGFAEFSLPKVHAPEPATRIYVDYWGWQGDPSGVRPFLESFINGIGGSAWLNTVTQYTSCAGAYCGSDGVGNVNGTYAILNNTQMLSGEYSETTAAPTFDGTNWTAVRSQVGAEAMRMQQHFGDFPGLYVIALPPSHWDFTRCGVHGSYTDSSGNTAWWVLLPYMPDAGSACGGGLPSVSITAGHEIAEALTDPQEDAWKTSTGNEIADDCYWPDHLGTISTPTGSFTIQALWSNATGSRDPNVACVFSYP